VRFLFVKEDLAWPRSAGHHVHTYEMMRALASLGHEIGLATAKSVAPRALDGLSLAYATRLDGPADPVSLSWSQERFRRYWGIAPSEIGRVAALAREHRADVVVAVGLHVLPYLVGVRNATRVWYAADEWIWHHLSQVRIGHRDARAHLREAVVKGLYERAFRKVADRVWVVSDVDRRAMRSLAGFAGVDVVPNGVDIDFFSPARVELRPETAVFWGRLDFGPNIQALEWFCSRVWTRLHSRRPSAEFTIIGFQPGEAVRRLAGRDGVVLRPDVEDLRAAVAPQAVVVLPFVSGGGIKNKLLEAAAMAKPVV
jgi:glycosyltransferase involved in cell wall biosynthesis